MQTQTPKTLWQLRRETVSYRRLFRRDGIGQGRSEICARKMCLRGFVEPLCKLGWGYAGCCGKSNTYLAQFVDPYDVTDRENRLGRIGEAHVEFVSGMLDKRGHGLDRHSALAAVEYDATVITTEVDVDQLATEHLVTRAGTTIGIRKRGLRARGRYSRYGDFTRHLN
jgi:hypothetical protein